MLLRYLLGAQFDLITVPCVDDALQKTKQSNFDLLLVDINLGEELTGVDLLQILRERDNYLDTPMIALTAYAMPGDYQRFIKLGFDAYVSKPFTRSELFEVIDAFLPKRIS